MNVDPEGHFFWFIFIGFLVGAAIGGTVNGIQAYRNGASGWDLVGAIFSGILVGGLIGAAVGGLIGVATVGLPSLGTGGLAFAGGGTAAIATTTQVAAALTAIGTMVLFARIGKSGGYKIDHHYPNDHDPMHVHVSGDDIIGGTTKVDLNGVPLPGQSPLTKGARKAFKRLLQKIKEALLPWM